MFFIFIVKNLHPSQIFILIYCKHKCLVAGTNDLLKLRETKILLTTNLLGNTDITCTKYNIFSFVVP
jgi:hypothetical protein